MNHRLKSLLWLRWQILQSNKFLLFVFLLSPYVDTYLFRIFVEMMGDTGTDTSVQMLISSLILGGLTYGNATLVVSTIVAEEKQKRNLRTLSLAGVTVGEYLLSVILIPFGAAMILGFLTPFVFGVPLTNWLLYFGLLLLTLLAYLLVGLVAGLVLKTVFQVMTVSIIVFLLSCFLPLAAGFSSIPILQGLVNVSLIGASHTFLLTGSVKWIPFLALCFWLTLFLVLAVWAYQRNRREER